MKEVLSDLQGENKKIKAKRDVVIAENEALKKSSRSDSTIVNKIDDMQKQLAAIMSASAK